MPPHQAALLAGRTVSATRSEPLPLDEDGIPIQTRIGTEAESTALNVVSILRETWEDFRNADRYFKFKAAILAAAWAVLSLAGVFVACPGAPTLVGPSRSLGAPGHGRREASTRRTGPPTRATGRGRTWWWW